MVILLPALKASNHGARIARETVSYVCFVLKGRHKNGSAYFVLRNRLMTCFEFGANITTGATVNEAVTVYSSYCRFFCNKR